MTFDRVSEVLDGILDYPSCFQLRNTFLDNQGKFSAGASTSVRFQQDFKTVPFVLVRLQGTITSVD